MDTIKNVGLIECNNAMGTFKTDALGNRHGFRLKKVMAPHASPEMTRLQYPQSEIVQDKRAITEDASIELIVIAGAAKSDLDWVAEVVQTGKHVRMV